MFDRLLSQFSRKRCASDAVSAQQLADKTNIYGKVVNDANEKKAKITPTQKVCLKCLAGESGHITHVLSSVSN